MARNYSSIAEAKTLTANVPETGTNSDRVSLSNNDGLPTAPFVLVLNPDTASEEVVLATSQISGSTYAITRNIESGGIKSHTAGQIVKHMIVGSDLQIVHDHFSNNSLTAGTAHGVTGGVVGRTSSQTLTNKAISLTDNTITGTKAQFNTAMSDADFATLTGTEELTNKTLTSPTVNTPTITSPTISGTITGSVITSANIVDSTIVNADINSSAAIDWTKLAISSTVSATELGYLDGVTSAVQTQIGTINTALTTNTPVGSITMWATATPPTGWLLCNGQSTTGYTALAAIVGSTVPDMQGFVPVGFKTSDDAFGTLKGTGGSKISTAAHTHDIDHNHGPFTTTGGEGAHVHTYSERVDNAGDSSAGTPQWDSSGAALDGGTYNAGTSAGAHNHSVDVPALGTTASGASSVGATNGNLQPYFTLNFIIKH